MFCTQALLIQGRNMLTTSRSTGIKFMKVVKSEHILSASSQQVCVRYSSSKRGKKSPKDHKVKETLEWNVGVDTVKDEIVDYSAIQKAKGPALKERPRPTSKNDGKNENNSNQENKGSDLIEQSSRGVTRKHRDADMSNLESTEPLGALTEKVHPEYFSPEDEPVFRPSSNQIERAFRSKDQVVRWTAREGMVVRRKIIPSDRSIILFPGQGAQFVGMGKKLLGYQNVKRMYDIASEILGYDLLQLSLQGPEEKLNRTEYCQPAILVASLAAVEKLKEIHPMAVKYCAATAGFSVGEYSSLVFSGALDYADAVRLIGYRARLMQRASEATPSGLMTVFIRSDSELKLATAAARSYCKERLGMEDPVCVLANSLSHNLKVIGGNIEALEFIQQHHEEFRLPRVRMLPVSGAFHTPLMYEMATREFRRALRATKFSKPLILCYSNTTGKRHGRVTRNIAQKLVQQMYRPVRWESIMHYIYDRKLGEKFPQTFECGPRQTLGVLLRHTNRKAYGKYKHIDV